MKFSIIIPVYNVAPYLHECLDSVLAQTYACWEAICIDDGSTDGSDAILDEYAAKDSRFRVIHQANAGVSSARNIGLKKSVGDYVAFVDGDDLVNSKWLEYVAEKIEGNSVDLIQFGVTQFDEKSALSWGACDEISIYAGWFWQKIYRRDVIGNIDFPNYRIGEDCAFMARVASAADTVAFVKRQLYGYRKRANSASHRLRTENDARYTLSYVYDSFKAYDNASIAVPYNVRRILANEGTEAVAEIMFNLKSKDFDSLSKDATLMWDSISQCLSFPSRQRFRLKLLRFLPFKFGLWILFVVPIIFKKRGFHRR